MTLIDTDVHVRWQTDRDLLPYLDETWHDRWLHGAGHTERGLRIKSQYYDPATWGVNQPGLESVHADAVATPDELRTGWLEPHGFDALLLSVYDAPLLATFGDTHFPTTLATAVNRWLADTFLDADPRFHGGIVVATQDPEAAAREIRRAAAHPRFTHVILPAGTNKPYGHPYYRPVFRAAVECGLAVVIASGTEGLGTSFAPTPTGWPGTVAEMRVVPLTNFLCHLTSLVTEGVFVDFPSLRIVAQEIGVAWLPTFLWRFDKNYKGLRSECPWVRELPSEIVCRHFRFTSQGAGPAEPAAEFWRLLDSLPDPDVLMYSSNHPRWDTEPPAASFALTTCPANRRASLAAGKALETFQRLTPVSVR
jgi:uncharacterized protein